LFSQNLAFIAPFLKDSDGPPLLNSMKKTWSFWSATMSARDFMAGIALKNYDISIIREIVSI